MTPTQCGMNGKVNKLLAILANQAHSVTILMFGHPTEILVSLQQSNHSKYKIIIIFCKLDIKAYVSILN